MAHQGLKIGMLFRGEFRRLGPHAGVARAWYEQGLPGPDLIVGGSAGAIIGAAVSPWSPWHFKHTEDVLCALRSRDIFRIPLEEKLAATLIAGAFAFPAVQTYLRKKKEIGPWELMIHAGVGLLGLGFSAYGARKLLAGPAIVDVSPLKGFLKRSYDFPAIRRSDIEVRIMATDIENGQHVMFSSHDRSLTNDDLLEAILCSCTIPVYMAVRSFKGRRLTDAEVRTDFPIGQFTGMDVVFDFSYTDGPAAYPRQKTWGDHFNGMWSTAKGVSSRLAKHEYERAREKDPTLPEVIPISTEREIPNQMMEDFDQETMKRSIELGRNILQENVVPIQEALERAVQRKRRNARWDRRLIRYVKLTLERVA